MTLRRPSIFWKRSKRLAKKTIPSDQRKTRRLLLEPLEDRRVLAIEFAGQPDWVEQGPFSTERTGISQGSVEGTAVQLGAHSKNSAIAAAVHAIAVDSSNPKIVYLGTVGGGVWKTDNINALAPDLAGVEIRTHVQGSAAADEQQLITVTTGGGGTFRLHVGNRQSADLNSVALVSAMRTELAALYGATINDFQVSTEAGPLGASNQFKYTVTFVGTPAKQNVAELTGSHQLPPLQFPQTSVCFPEHDSSATKSCRRNYTFCTTSANSLPGPS